MQIAAREKVAAEAKAELLRATDTAPKVSVLSKAEKAGLRLSAK